MNKHKELILSVMLRQSEDAFEQLSRIVKNRSLEQTQKLLREDSSAEIDVLANYMRGYISCREAIDWLRDLPD